MSQLFVAARTDPWIRPHDFEEIGAAMAEGMGGAAPPAQVLLGVTSLALPELLIEIEVVVSLP